MLSWLRDSCWPTGVTAGAPGPGARQLQRGIYILCLLESQWAQEGRASLAGATPQLHHPPGGTFRW